MFLHRYKEAIRECNHGLAVQGTNAKILRQRAQARFESDLYKDALSDIQKVNASAAKSEETIQLESKIRERLSGKGSSNGAAAGEGGSAAGNGAVTDVLAAAKAGKAPTYSKQQAADLLRQNSSTFVCKITLDSETKYVHVPFGVTYYQLQQAIKAKWTGLHNFKIFFHDKDNDWVLITCARDVAKAQNEILTYAQRLLNQRHKQGLDSQVRDMRDYIFCWRGVADWLFRDSFLSVRMWVRCQPTL
jgi:hypothetical protein